MVYAFFIPIRLSIVMGIEMDHRQRTMFFGMGLQQRIADEVIATQRQHGRPGPQDLVCVRFIAAGVS